MQHSEHSAVATRSGDVSVSSHHHDPKSSGIGECNPFICQVVVLLTQNSEAALGQSNIDPEFHIIAQAKPNEPDSPYRPPEL